MENTIVNLLESIGYVYFIINYININQKYKHIYSYILFICSFIILTTSSYISNIDQISIFIINSIAFIMCYRYSDNSIFEIIFLLLFVETLIIISNIFALLISSYIFHSDIHTIFSISQRLFITSLFSKLLFCSLSILSSKVIKKRNYAFSKSIFILLLISIISFFTLTYNFTNLLTNQFNQKTYFILLIILSILLILNYVLYNIIKEENYVQMIKNIQFTELENMKFFIEATKNINDENIKLKHCLDNVLLILKKEKHNQKIKDICLKIENIENNIQFIETENSIINNIFNTVMILYKEKNIQWNLFIESNLLKIDSLDLAIILDSILKLAIENTNSNEEIIFKTKEKEKFYYLSLKFKCKERFKTELYSILLENIIKKYSGEITIIEENSNTVFFDIIIKKIN